MTGQEKIKQILAAIKSGKTVCFVTPWKIIKVNQHTLERLKVLKIEPFKAKANSAYVASGGKYVCIDYCPITLSVGG